MAAALGRGAGTALIESPIRESRANGAVEGALQIRRGYFRTIKDDLETRLNTNIDREHPLMTWLEPWSGGAEQVQSEVQWNGPYAMITGHRSKHMVAGFGEIVQGILAKEKAGEDKYEGHRISGYFGSKRENNRILDNKG